MYRSCVLYTAELVSVKSLWHGSWARSWLDGRKNTTAVIRQTDASKAAMLTNERSISLAG